MTEKNKKRDKRTLDEKLAEDKAATQRELDERAAKTKGKLVVAPKPMGRPPDYRPEYCSALERHMRGGNSFESFGAEAGCGKATLYRWAENYPDFRESAQKGRQLCAKFYEELGKMMATGQLRRISKEEPILDDEYRPIIDPATGQVMKRYEYAATQGNAAAWIFLTKNMLGWRDKRDVAFEGVPGGSPIQVRNVTEMTDAELDQELKALARKILEEP